MSDLVDAIAQKLHLRKSSKCDGSSPTSSEEEVGDAADVDDVAATLTNDFGVNFECVSAQCQYNDTKLIPPGIFARFCNRMVSFNQSILISTNYWPFIG